MKSMTSPACQLYLISPLDTGGDFPQRLEQALKAGPVAAFQFRVKGLEQHEAASLAAPLQQICAENNCAFIVNDDIALAKRLGADGVHLGQSDDSVADAREVLGKDVQIGVTCHASRDLGLDAGDDGADYVAFGAFFDSETKNTKHRATTELLKWWALMVELPCVAIGGLTPENAGPIVKAGADFIAVSAAVWNDPNGPGAAVTRFIEIINANPAEISEL